MCFVALTNAAGVTHAVEIAVGPLFLNLLVRGIGKVSPARTVLRPADSYV